MLARKSIFSLLHVYYRPLSLIAEIANIYSAFNVLGFVVQILIGLHNKSQASDIGVKAERSEK